MIDRSLRDRYSRQTMFPGIGEEGQAKLLKSCVIIIGCGALGSNIATFLVRAGVGKVKIVDRDFIEYHNLQRQVLFDEDDIKARLPKAIAAERRLRKINSTVTVQGIIADINYTNIEALCSNADIILDGLDNLETRYLINDVALKHEIPWIYGGAIASDGMTITIVPGETPCLRCIFPVSPPPETTATCETAGIVGTVPAIIGAIQATEAIKILVGEKEINHELIMLDVWKCTHNHFRIKPRDNCPTCSGRYEFLDRRFKVKATSLCGQSRAVQVIDTDVKTVAFNRLEKQLKSKDVSQISHNDFMLTFNTRNHEVIIFPDGRAIIKNTTDKSEAIGLYKKYVRELV